MCWAQSATPPATCGSGPSPWLMHVSNTHALLSLSALTKSVSVGTCSRSNPWSSHLLRRDITIKSRISVCSLSTAVIFLLRLPVHNASYYLQYFKIFQNTVKNMTRCELQDLGNSYDTGREKLRIIITVALFGAA